MVQPIAGVCVDIDGQYWNGHGKGSGCRHCDPLVEIDYSAATLRCPVCNEPFSPQGLKIHRGMRKH